MKRFALALAIFGAGLAVSPIVTTLTAHAAGGGGNAAPTPMKIGIIDIERTLYDTPAGKRASDAFDKEREKKQADLDKDQKALQKDAADLDKQAGMLKPEVLKQKRDDLEKRFVDLNKKYAQLERELAEARTKAIQGLLAQAQPIIKDIAKQEQVDLILDQSAVLYADSKIDLTQKLNDKMK
jgi:outer membrane protein